MTQYEAGYCEVCKAILNLPRGESRGLEAGRNAQVVSCTEIEVG